MPERVHGIQNYLLNKKGETTKQNKNVQISDQFTETSYEYDVHSSVCKTSWVKEPKN